MTEKCKNCKIYKKLTESKEAACCAWYIDNVFLGAKTVDACTAYDPIVENTQTTIPTVMVRTQLDLDNIDPNYDCRIVIDADEVITVRHKYANRVVVKCTDETRCGTIVYVYGHAEVDAYDNCLISARDHSIVIAHDDVHVDAFENAHVNAYDTAIIHAHDSATINGYDASVVYADTFVTVMAEHDSTVHASGDARILAFGSSTVFAYDNVQVEIRDQSTAECHDFVVCTCYNNTNRCEVHGMTTVIDETKPEEVTSDDIS